MRMMINLKHFLRIYSRIAFIFLLLFCIPVTAQTGEKIVAEIQQLFKNRQNFEADFEQKFFNSTGDNTMTLKGKYSQAEGGKFRISLENNEIISDGVNVWNVDKRMQRVVISNAEDRTNSFSLETIINVVPSKCKINLLKNTNENYQLELTPVENLGFEKVDLSVSRDYLIKSVSIKDYNGNVIKFDLNNYNFTSMQESSKFNYVPTEGIEIIDLR